MPNSIDAKISPAIHARQTALLYRNAGSGQFFTVLAAIPTAYLGYLSKPGPVILVWLFFMVVVSLMRYRLALGYQAAHPPEAEADRWSARYIRYAAVQAAVWLVGGSAIMWNNTDSYRFLVALVMVGMVAGAVPVLSAVKLAFRLYAGVMIVGAALVTFVNANELLQWVLGIMLLIFIAGITRASNYFNDLLLESITLEVEKSQLVEKAQSAVRARSEFLANISHEIRTPMNSILGMAQLALLAEHDPRQRDYLEKIQLSGEHLLHIIDDILDISKVDAGKLAIETVDFDLAEVIRNLTTLVAKRAEEKKLRLVLDVAPAVPRYLRGDPLRLCQVLANLTNNAIKFTEQGEVTVRVRLLTENGRDTLCFEVLDTGIGMSKAEMARLFQPFQQADSSTTRKYGGTGLGLVICKQLVEMMAGKIGVESVPGAGSTFWFTVRLAVGAEPAAQVAGPQGAESAKAEAAMLKTIHGARILLVDDNAFNLEVAIDFLLGVGARGSTASNGKEALDLLRRERFDCVLLDVQMPVMDGIEAVRQIRGDPAIAGIPVIAMTANASREDRERYLAAGMDDVIVKPFKYQILFATLAQWLGRDKAGGEAPVAALAETLGESAGRRLAGNPNIIDLSVLAETIGHDRKKLSEFSSKFIASIQQDMEAVEAALARNDILALGKLGHRGKSPARTMGAMGFANLCQELEENARTGDLHRARAIVEQLRLLPAQIRMEIARVLS